MRTLLICPKAKENIFSAPPTGLCYIKASLVDAGYSQTKVIDIDNYKEGFIIKVISDFKPDMVGISCLTELRMYSVKLARVIKNNFPHITIALGGIHPTHLYRQMLLHYNFIDYVCIGEGEHTFTELAKAIEGEMKLEEVAGIAYRKDNRVHKNKARKPIENLDELPFPNYDDFDLHNYEIIYPYFERKPILFVVSSRGCINRCGFCSTAAFWKGWRRRSPENVIKEIDYLVERYKIKTIKFADDVFTADKERALTLCEKMIEKDYDIFWSALTRIDCFDEEIVTKMRDAGCRLLSFGAESASDEVLARMNKKQTAKDIYGAFDICKKVGLTTELSLIVGNPGETDKSIAEDKELIKYVKPEVLAVSMMILLPNTPLYEKSKQEGLCSDDFWLTEEPRLRYTGAISYEQMLKYQRELYLTFVLSTGLKGLLYTVKYALKLLLRDAGRIMPHFIPNIVRGKGR